MSLTNDITHLTGQVTSLTARVSDWIDAADAKIQQALDTVPELSVTIYVDQVTGDDTAAGSRDAPLASIEKAIDRIGPTRYGAIRLLSDYSMPRRIFTQHNSTITLIGDGAQRRVELGLHQVPDPADAGFDWEVGGFMTGSKYGVSAFNFMGLEIIWPSAPSAGTVSPDRYSALVGCYSSCGPAMVATEICNCRLTYPADGEGVVIGADSRSAALAVKVTTYDAQAMAGKWIAGVAAGTQTTDTPQVISNLSTL